MAQAAAIFLKNFVLRGFTSIVPMEDAECLIRTMIPSICGIEQAQIARQLVACLEPMLQVPEACGTLMDEIMTRLRKHWAAGQEVQVVSMVRCLKFAFKASLRVDHREERGQAVVAILEPQLQQGMVAAFELLEMCNESQFHQVRKLLSGVIMFGVHGCQLQNLLAQPGLLAGWLRALLDVCREPMSEELPEDAQQCLWKAKRRCCDSLRTLLNLDSDSLGSDENTSLAAKQDLQEAFGGFLETFLTILSTSPGADGGDAIVGRAKGKSS